QFPNNSVDDVLGVYELLTGKAVVKDTEIFEGPKISLVTAAEVSLPEAIKLIESALQANGYIIVPETDGSAVRVLMKDVDLATVSEGLKVLMDVGELPTGRQLASFFLPLEHLDPVEASIVFSTHVGLNDYGRLTPVSRPRGLLITENSALIRHFVKLKDVLDAPQRDMEQETKFYELEFAESSVLAEILNATFKTRQTPPTLTEDTLGDRRSVAVKRTETERLPQVVADGRLNRLMVVAGEEDHAFVAKVVEEFDRPIELTEPYERGLKYVFVDEILPVLVDLLQDTGTGISSLPDGGSVTTRIPPQASTDASTLTGRVRRGVQRREEASTEIGGRADTLLDPEADNAPISVLVGKTRIIADMQANNILVLGPKPDVEKIDQMIDRLDRRPPQVYLATVIGQLTLDEGMEVGVDYVRKYMETGDGGYAGGLITTDGELAGAVGALTGTSAVVPAISALEGFSFFGRVQDDLDILVRAMETTGKFKVLSRPSVFAANNKKAVIASGTRIPVPTSSITDLGNSDNVRTNIDFQDVVLK
ncbi:MAG: secretin N-terminal domain-containing protein, partial [Verrucomicrobiales bacterium]|nr:secretin N-terminal domain-containing protein [Verrucomicrobiales bacterium]